MKRLFSLLMLFAFITSAGMAQVPAKRTTSTAPASMMQNSKGVIIKKDGTPDKRFKANQAAKPTTAGPMKKDGTPDQRYKANKSVAPKM
ncbi:MAG: hypothetical protein ACRYFA_08615 [Janthinobacterium lividum]